MVHLSYDYNDFFVLVIDIRFADGYNVTQFFTPHYSYNVSFFYLMHIHFLILEIHELVRMYMDVNEHEILSILICKV